MAENVGQALGVGGAAIAYCTGSLHLYHGWDEKRKIRKCWKPTVKIDSLPHNALLQMKEDYRPAFACGSIRRRVCRAYLSVVGLVTVAILDIGGEFAVMLMVVGLLRRLPWLSAVYFRWNKNGSIRQASQ